MAGSSRAPGRRGLRELELNPRAMGSLRKGFPGTALVLSGPEAEGKEHRFGGSDKTPLHPSPLLTVSVPSRQASRFTSWSLVSSLEDADGYGRIVIVSL